MAIPEAQLETWAKQGAIPGSSKTYNLVKETLEEDVAPYHGKNYEVFLQGSYGNSTNIYAESDVDVIIVLRDCWRSDLNRLNDAEKAAYKKSFGDAKYGDADFKRDVLTVLRNEYGGEVKAGNKAILVPPSDVRRSCDVISAIQFRRYFKFNNAQDQSYEEGICFFDGTGKLIQNFPKQHRENMKNRHQELGEWLKPMARIMKNARTRLVEDGALADGVAPSYFIEGLVYNAPAMCFGESYRDSLLKILQWMEAGRDSDKWVTANKQYYLLRDGYTECWPKANYEAFKGAMIDLWNEWG